MVGLSVTSCEGQPGEEGCTAGPSALVVSDVSEAVGVGPGDGVQLIVTVESEEGAIATAEGTVVVHDSGTYRLRGDIRVDSPERCPFDGTITFALEGELEDPISMSIVGSEGEFWEREVSLWGDLVVSLEWEPWMS